MRKTEDITGQKFGNLTVQKLELINDKYYATCLCDCGNIVTAIKYNVINGVKSSCGCLNISVRKIGRYNLVGQRFGKLLVLEETTKETSSRVSKAWKCQCDCGNTIDVVTNSLTGIHESKGTRSCGCTSSPNLIGEKFGSLLVIDYGKFDRIQYWKCKCDCGSETSVTGTKLKSGHTQTCGHCFKTNVITHHPDWLGGEFLPDFIVLSIIRRSRDKGIEYNLTVKFLENLFLKQEGKCALTGELLTVPQKARDVFTISLDRIDSSKGYTEDNVQWVHKDVNILKMDNSDEELVYWAEKLANYNKDKLEQVKWMKFLNFCVNL